MKRNFGFFRGRMIWPASGPKDVRPARSPAPHSTFPRVSLPPAAPAFSTVSQHGCIAATGRRRRSRRHHRCDVGNVETERIRLSDEAGGCQRQARTRVRRRHGSWSRPVSASNHRSSRGGRRRSRRLAVMLRAGAASGQWLGVLVSHDLWRLVAAST